LGVGCNKNSSNELGIIYPRDYKFESIESFISAYLTWNPANKKYDLQYINGFQGYQHFDIEDYQTLRPETSKYDFGISKIRFLNNEELVFMYMDSTKFNDTLAYVAYPNKSNALENKLIINGFKFDPFVFHYLGYNLNNLSYCVMYYKIRNRDSKGISDTPIVQRFVTKGDWNSESKFLADSLQLVVKDTLIVAVNRFWF
jgi:hypothetical protein